MAKFRIGQLVHLTADRHARTQDTYQVTRVQPGNGDQQYRIKSARDPHERVVLESEIEAVPAEERPDPDPPQGRAAHRFRPRDTRKRR